MNIIDDLLAFYNATPEGDIYHDAVMHIMDHIKSFRNATIYQMADMCYVSPSTMSRLCRKLGCESYAAFRDEILHVLDNYDNYNRIVPTTMVSPGKDACDALLDTVERSIQDLRSTDKRIYEKLADVIHSGDPVGIYSDSNASSTFIIQNTLVAAGQKIRPHNRRNLFNDAHLFKKGSVVLFQYPYFKETAALTQVLKECSNNGATTIVITTHAPESLSLYANYFYNFDGCQTIMDNYKRDLFLNMIIMAYRQKYIDKPGIR